MLIMEDISFKACSPHFIVILIVSQNFRYGALNFNGIRCAHKYIAPNLGYSSTQGINSSAKKIDNPHRLVIAHTLQIDYNGAVRTQMIGNFLCFLIRTGLIQYDLHIFCEWILTTFAR